MTREEFMSLYEKCMAGKCTDAEKELLNAYQDDMQLLNDTWDDSASDEHKVKSRIFQKLQESKNAADTPVKKLNNWKWLKVAAVLIVSVTIGYLLIKPNAGNNNPSPQLTAIDTIKTKLKPGNNKAYLTLANGTQIILSDVHSGKLAEQAGIKISKAKDGLLVYNFDTQGKTLSSTDTTTTYNTITTPRGEQYQLLLQDGTKVWLNAATTLRFPVAFKGKQRRVELTGEAYFEVAKNKEKPFMVHANGTQVQVLGTHFNVNAYRDDEDMVTTLLEGSVRIVKGKSQAQIIPGQQAIVLNNGTRLSVKPANIDQTIAWKNGFFTFHDTKITEIMKTLVRWYDIEVEYQGNVTDREFGGTISRYKNITELLNNMKLTGAIHYKIEGRRVIIME